MHSPSLAINVSFLSSLPSKLESGLGSSLGLLWFGTWLAAQMCGCEVALNQDTSTRLTVAIPSVERLQRC